MSYSIYTIEWSTIPLGNNRVVYDIGRKMGAGNEFDAAGFISSFYYAVPIFRIKYFLGSQPSLTGLGIIIDNPRPPLIRWDIINRSFGTIELLASAIIISCFWFELKFHRRCLFSCQSGDWHSRESQSETNLVLSTKEFNIALG